MTETERQRVIEDESFVAAYMYVGRGSRRPWILLAGTLLFSALFILGSLWLYDDLAAWERAGSPERWEDMIVAGLYRLGGKGLVRNVGLGVGALLAIFGVTAYLRARAARQASLGRRL